MKIVRLRIPDLVAQYFEATHGNITKISQTLLDDAFQSILMLEATENPAKICRLIRMLGS